VTERVLQFFRDPECGVLTGRTLDREGRESVSPHRSESGFVDRDNVFSSGNSNTLFARKAVAVDVGGFDETLGVGAGTPFQSGEETDFLLRCLRKDYQVYYDRGFVVRHDQNIEAGAAQIARAGAYSQGFGRLLRMHDYGIVYLGAGIGRALVRGGLCLATGDVDGARRRYDWVKGALRGYLAGAVPRHGQVQRSFGLRG
jgi:GT2 family glycosyltransferase